HGCASGCDSLRGANRRRDGAAALPGDLGDGRGMSFVSLREWLNERVHRGLPAAVAAALVLSGCAGDAFNRITGTDNAIANDQIAASLPPAQRREHERLVASYGGVYRSKDLDALIAKTVDRLTAASEN